MMSFAGLVIGLEFGIINTYIIRIVVEFNIGSSNDFVSIFLSPSSMI
jgi:hypothetical protein